MSKSNHRILLHITMLSGNDRAASRKADATYYRFNNVLGGNGRLPNIAKICAYCDGVNRELGAYIRNQCFDIDKQNVLFEPPETRNNSLLNKFGRSKRRKIRIMLYPGRRDDIDGLNMQETTHNMIVQFNDTSSCFCATEPHSNAPSFYQNCISTDMALRYLEALLVDACICHYLGISDVASHHDDKQRISKEKVLFILELAKKTNLNYLSHNGQRLVKYVSEQINDTTPYISFLSIFTIAPYDVYSGEEFWFFEDYCSLWSEFQRWYFDRHGRLFSKNKPIKNPLDTVFYRNKYHGQISRNEITSKIIELQEKHSHRMSNPPFKEESRFAIIIFKHVPEGVAMTSQCDALFSGKLHQAKWDIVYWGDLGRYKSVRSYLEVIPIMIVE